MVAQNLFFYGIAAVIVYSGFRVVTTDNVVHAALHLVAVLASVAAQYVLLAAEFVAATQVLVYIGAIVVLFLFGIMLTRAKLGRDQDLTNKSWPMAAATALAALRRDGLRPHRRVPLERDADARPTRGSPRSTAPTPPP